MKSFSINMTINKFGSHISKKYAKYRSNYFPFSSLKTEKHIDANKLRILNLAKPVASTDAVNKIYADTLALFYTELKNWPGNFIDGGGKRLANFAPPIDGYDVITKDYLTANALTLSKDKYDAGGKSITNVGQPSRDTDVVTLAYLKKELKKIKN